jgi:hypothetical protein
VRSARTSCTNRSLRKRRDQQGLLCRSAEDNRAVRNDQLRGTRQRTRGTVGARRSSQWVRMEASARSPRARWALRDRNSPESFALRCTTDYSALRASPLALLGGRLAGVRRRFTASSRRSGQQVGNPLNQFGFTGSGTLVTDGIYVLISGLVADNQLVAPVEENTQLSY